jgi:hypothetical protein
VLQALCTFRLIGYWLAFYFVPFAFCAYET